MLRRSGRAWRDAVARRLHSGRARDTVAAMLELLRTNNPVTISFATSLLGEAGIAHFVADENMSIVEGSLGMLPRRIMVDGESLERARRLLADAGIAHELR